MKLVSQLKKNIPVLFFSLIYSILGGIVICSTYPTDPLYGNWVKWLWLLTLPVNLLGTTYRFFDNNGGDYLNVLIIQLLTFIVFSFILLKIKNKTKREIA